MRNSYALLLPFLLVACGGGSGSASESEASIPQEAREVRAVLESCASEGIQKMLGLMDTLLPTGGAPAITIDAAQGDVIPFHADLDDDGTPDLTGALRFLDSDGMPLQPFTEEELAGGIEVLVPLLSRLPRGARMLIETDPAPGAGIERATFATRFLGGLPVSVDASATMIVDTCLVTISFDGVSVLSLLGDVPSLVADLRVLDGNDEIVGTVRLDGDDSARIDAARNGGESYAFLLDLVGGALTPLG